MNSLSGFREVEQGFRLLDGRMRERITLWEGAKGELPGDILGERDAIADASQEHSFRSFRDFLMASRQQEDLTTRLDRALALPPAVTRQRMVFRSGGQHCL